jgi:hypothetical protein
MSPPISMKKSKWKSLGIKTRKHHNNTGYRQIKRGKTRSQVERIAKKLKIPYGKRQDHSEEE